MPNPDRIRRVRPWFGCRTHIVRIHTNKILYVKASTTASTRGSPSKLAGSPARTGGRATDPGGSALRRVSEDLRLPIIEQWQHRCAGGTVSNPFGYLMTLIQRAVQGKFNASWAPEEPAERTIPATERPSRARHHQAPQRLNSTKFKCGVIPGQGARSSAGSRTSFGPGTDRACHPSGVMSHEILTVEQGDFPLGRRRR